MPEPIQGDALDLSQIEDHHVRRAIKTLHTQMTTTLHRQQLEIDALLEMMLEKHVGSIGEFKRHLVRLQQDQSRSQRLHAAMATTAHAPTAPTAPGMNRGIH